MLFLLTVAAAQDPATMAERLAALRAEVATLSEELSHQQSEARADLRSREQARAELEMQIREETARIESLQRALERHEQTLAATDTSKAFLGPELQVAGSMLLGRIEAGIPYRRAERRQAVLEILEDLDQDTLSPERAASRLWQVTEDELRLARENGLDKQTIEIDGTTQLVSVARLGMVALYFRTRDGRVGLWDGSRWVRRDDRESQQQIAALFDALTKQIRVGWFTLPLPRG